MQAVKAMGKGMVERHGERPGRDQSEPAFTIRASAGGMEPGGFRWQPDRKDSTMNDPIRLLPREAATLQSYPEDFQFAGNKGDVFQQIGNAYPPLMAQRTLEALWAPNEYDDVELAA